MDCHAAAAAAAVAPRLPKVFGWHVFIGMVRALFYLATGQREVYGLRLRASWRPLVHCGMQARNIFLRKNVVTRPRQL
jgi:hypothetical protein